MSVHHADSSTIPTPFAEIPDSETLNSLVDVYFRNCHNQPYRYFNEDNFRKNVEEAVLPSYLLLAVAATAVRFSRHALYQGRHQEATNSYSKQAWVEIVHQSCLDNSCLNIHMVQAANMLSIIDYVGRLPSFECTYGIQS
jgi:hypothetical protein